MYRKCNDTSAVLTTALGTEGAVPTSPGAHPGDCRQKLVLGACVRFPGIEGWVSHQFFRAVVRGPAGDCPGAGWGGAGQGQVASELALLHSPICLCAPCGTQISTGPLLCPGHCFKHFKPAK